MHQAFRWNGTDYYTVFDLPISVSNGIEKGDDRVDCALLENQYEPGVMAASNQSIPEQPWVGEGAKTVIIEDESSAQRMNSVKGLWWIVAGLVFCTYTSGCTL